MTMQPPPVGAGQEWQPGSWTPDQQPAPRRRRRAVIALIASAVGAAAVGLGVSATTGDRTSVISGSGHRAGTGVAAAPAADTTGQATEAQQVGVVDINTELRYRGAQAAGTGMILTGSGEVLTNNHVVDGATSIRVTVVSTGDVYDATVVGTDPSDDVAVLQLRDASGLDPVTTADSSDVSVGDAVTAVGNALGRGGTPSAATGSVTGVERTLTAGDATGDAETLTG